MANFGKIRQIAYLTDNIEQAMEAWIGRSGVGPFIWYRNLELPVVHRGEDARVAMEVAIAYRGDCQIELIQQTNEAPSPYRPYFEKGQMGLHHLAYITEDIDRSLETAKADGFEITTTISAPIGRYAYFQDPAMPENYFEFLEVGDDLAAYWEQCIEEAANWNGDEPIREMDMTGV
jgi:catechol 2,3-dioxygenase-like lactoylglutathione lyase family enzyme